MVELDGRLWMAADLTYETAEGSWVDRNYTDEGPQYYTRIYNFKWAQRACPPGWRLPSYGEWSDMLLSYGCFRETLSDVAGEDPKRAYEALLSGGESGFNARPGNYYWSQTGRSGHAGGSFLFDDDSQTVITAKTYTEKHPCRCVHD